MRSGQPLTVFVQNNWSRSQWSPSIAPTTGLDRPDLAPGRSPESAVLGRPDQWFDPAAFVLQPQGTLGNSAARRVPRSEPAHRGRRRRAADRRSAAPPAPNCGSRCSTCSTARTSATRR